MLYILLQWQFCISLNTLKTSLPNMAATTGFWEWYFLMNESTIIKCLHVCLLKSLYLLVGHPYFLLVYYCKHNQHFHILLILFTRHTHVHEQSSQASQEFGRNKVNLTVCFCFKWSTRHCSFTFLRPPNRVKSCFSDPKWSPKIFIHRGILAHRI